MAAASVMLLMWDRRVTDQYVKMSFFDWWIRAIAICDRRVSRNPAFSPALARRYGGPSASDCGEYSEVARATGAVRSSPKAEANALLGSNTADHLRDRPICRRR